MNMPHSDFFVDIELKSDFLSAKYKVVVFALDKDNKKYVRVAQTHWENENNENDVGSMSKDLI